MELDQKLGAPEIDDEPPLLDRRTIETLARAIGPATIRMMYGLFTTQTRACLERLSDPNCLGEAMKDECHALCGAAATLGFTRLSESASMLEARSSLTRDHIDQLDKMVDQSFAALADLYPELCPAY